MEEGLEGRLGLEHAALECPVRSHVRRQQQLVLRGHDQRPMHQAHHAI